MRFLIINLVTAALLVFSAATASAVTYTVVDNSGGDIAVGDSVVLVLSFDTTDLTDDSDTTLGWGISIGIDGSAWNVEPGGSQNELAFATVIPSFGTFGGVPLVSPLPPNNGLDPNIIRAGVWGSATAITPNPWGNEVLATVTVTAMRAGTFDLTPFFAPGDSFELNGDANYPANFVGTTITVVPEPGTALLMGLGLAGLAAAGRRQA